MQGYGTASGAMQGAVRTRQPASPAAAVIATVGVAALGLVVAACLVAVHTATPAALVDFPEHTEDGAPLAPPVMDHVMLGTGPEDRLGRRAFEQPEQPAAPRLEAEALLRVDATVEPRC